MRLLFLHLLGLIAYCNSHLLREVDFKIYSNSNDEFDSIVKVAKLINADNRYITVSSKVVNCIENASENHCSEITNDEIIIVLSHYKLEEKLILSNEEGQKVKYGQLVQSAFDRFFTKCLIHFETESHRLDDDDVFSEYLRVHFVTSSYQEYYNKALLTSEEELNAFIERNKEEKVYFVLKFHFDLFESLLYAANAIDVSLSTGFHLGIVDCGKSPTMCSTTSFPSLISYKDIKEYKVYDGELVYEEIRDWAKRLANPVLSVLSTDIVPMYRSGVVPGFEGVQDTVNMLFTSTKEHQVYKDYLNFAIENHGKYHLTVMVEAEIAKWPNQPAFITMKPTELVSKAFVKFEDITYESMAHYLSTSIHPSIHDLNSPQSVLTALSIGSPLTIFYDPTKLKDQNAFAKLASEHPIRQNTSEFAVVIGSNVFGKYFIESLGLGLSKPMYISLNSERTCVHTKAIAKENRDEIVHWIRSSLKKPCEQEIVFNLNRIINLSQWDSYETLCQQLYKEHSLEHDEL